MKKITFLVAAVLASAGMSAQTATQKWGAINDMDAEELLFPWNSVFPGWIGVDENPMNRMPNHS